MKINLFTILLLCYMPLSWGQNAELSQTINGQVVDQLTGTPLIGASVIVENSDPLIGAITDETGSFRLKEVPLGRRSLEVSYLGYEKQHISGLILGSGQELHLEIRLIEAVNELELIEVISRPEVERLTFFQAIDLFVEFSQQSWQRM